GLSCEGPAESAAEEVAAPGWGRPRFLDDVYELEANGVEEAEGGEWVHACGRRAIREATDTVPVSSVRPHGEASRETPAPPDPPTDPWPRTPSRPPPSVRRSRRSRTRSRRRSSRWPRPTTPTRSWRAGSTGARRSSTGSARR